MYVFVSVVCFVYLFVCVIVSFTLQSACLVPFSCSLAYSFSLPFVSGYVPVFVCVVFARSFSFAFSLTLVRFYLRVHWIFCLRYRLCA